MLAITLIILLIVAIHGNTHPFHNGMTAKLPMKLSVSINGQHLTTKAVGFERISRIRGGMNLRVKTLAGKTITVTAEKSDSIQVLKSKIATEAGIPLQQQRLLLSGKQLDNSKTVGDYDELGNDSVLHLVLRLRGGVYLEM